MICNNILAFFPSFGPTEMIVIAGLGLLIFGNKLPDVGRSLGRGLVEFKKGLKGVQDDIDNADSKDQNGKDDSKTD